MQARPGPFIDTMQTAFLYSALNWTGERLLFEHFSRFPRRHAAVVLAFACVLLVAGCGETPEEFAGEGGIFDSPLGIVVNGDFAYVMNGNFDLSDESDGAITVIDIPRSLVNRKDCIVGRVKTPAYIGKMVLTRDGRTGYIANRAGDTILYVDLADPALPKIVDLDPGRDGDQGVRVGIEPFGLTLSPDERMLYVTNVGSGDLSIVDLAGERLVKNEQMEWGINDIAIQPGATPRYAYITNKGLNAVAIFDIITNRFVTAFPVGSMRTGLGSDTRGIDFTPDGKWAFIAARHPESLLVVDTSKVPGQVERAVVDLLPMDLSPTAVKVAPGGEEVWVTNFDSNNVYAIDIRSRSVLDVIPVGGGPYDIAFTEEDPDQPGQYYVLVANFRSHNVSLIDGRTKEYVWVIP